MADREWVSAHVFYSDDLDRVLTGAVRPLVGELLAAGLVRGYFFLRYWEGGPHVRLRLLPSAPGAAGDVQDLVADRCGRYLRDSPSRTAVAAAGYATLAARLARWEGLASHTATLYPNNSVQFIAYRPEHDRYGTGARLHAVERHFTDSSQIALALVSAGTPAAARETAGFCAALLAWLLCPPHARAPGLPGLPGEPAEPAEPGEPGGPGDADDPAGAYRLPDLAERYASQRDRLLALGEAMRDLASGADTPGGGLPKGRFAGGGLAAWRDSVAALRDALLPHRDAGAAAQVVDTCVHLFCNRLGVSLPGEGYLRYLAARTAADLRERG